jgi:2-succinyl-5-enolpyruvyl-6-hydroxy-3-cyclohexene-1-carboxylate synthase
MNPNMFYAETFVGALVQSGLQAVCIAPGSRSTPLTLAFAKHDGIKKYTHLDERSAAFFALGMAMASDEPVAMVCTSGTAVANFFPAIIEANMSRVPLLILTADRPHELRHSGANQTIDQIKMYGDHVLWSVDMPLPEPNPPEVAVRNLRTMAARALATADGRMGFRRKGVVHLNFPFRKPLEPTLQALPAVAEAEPVQIFRSDAHLASEDQDWIAHQLWSHTGIIVCGPNCPGGEFRRSIFELAAKYDLPIFADPLSGIRYGYGEVVSAYENDLELDSTVGTPQLVVRFGGVPTSKVLNTYLNQLNPDYYFQFSHDGTWADDSHRVTHLIGSNPNAALRGLIQHAEEGKAREQCEHVSEIDAAFARGIEIEVSKVYFDGAVVRCSVDKLPEHAALFVGNSNAVRHLDQFVPNTGKRIIVYASRGASGIDGQVSTALGIGAATGQHIYAILGDITFYHDMNGLLAIQRNGVTATIIVINNNGGGIFERLPIREHEPYHTDYFLTPHGLTFEHAAALYGLEYAYADDFTSLDAALEKYINADVSSIIEVKTDIKTDEARRQEIIKTVNEQIRQRLSDSE